MAATIFSVLEASRLHQRTPERSKPLTHPLPQESPLTRTPSIPHRHTAPLVQELQTARIKDRREKGGERERSIASAVACRGTTLASLLKKLLAEPSASGAPVAYYALRPAAATAARTTPRARRSAATTTTSPATTAAASTRMPTPVAAVAPASSLKVRSRPCVLV